MTKEILINYSPLETRLALVENTVLKEIHIDRGEDPSLVGNIYKAKVLRVIPGMQAAFVDIGAKRNAFLHIDDIHCANSQDKIADTLRDGQDILVQVLKDSVNKKGALLTTDISIATEYLVYRQGRVKPGISAKIKPKSERTRLNDLMDSIVSSIQLPDSLSGNFILRSAAEGIKESQLTEDINSLIEVWRSIESLKAQKSPVSVYKETQRSQRLVRQMLSLGIDKIIVDSPSFFESLEAVCNQSRVTEKPIINLYKEQGNLFDTYQIESQINAALKSDVPLNCGGHIVIEETEALSAIDVNTGSFIGESIDHSTFLKVNLEAAEAAAKQIKLRNLTGIIIIDFIDMKVAEHRRQVLQQLKQAFSEDKAITIISDFTELGLIQIARKRTSPSLSQILCAPCGRSETRKLFKSKKTLAIEIFRELSNIELNGKWQALEIFTSEPVIETIKNKYAVQLNEFKNRTGCDVKLCIESSFPSDQFNIIPV